MRGGVWRIEKWGGGTHLRVVAAGVVGRQREGEEVRAEVEELRLGEEGGGHLEVLHPALHVQRCSPRTPPGSSRARHSVPRHRTHLEESLQLLLAPGGRPQSLQRLQTEETPPKGTSLRYTRGTPLMPLLRGHTLKRASSLLLGPRECPQAPAAPCTWHHRGGTPQARGVSCSWAFTQVWMLA